MLNVSIVLFKNPEEQIRNLLSDILASKAGLINKIYLVDNSPDEKLAILKNLDTSIVYCKQQNNGYGAGHNVAIKESISNNIKYHLVVNPDIRMQETALADIFKYMDLNLDVGLVMPDICYPDGSRQHLCKLLPTPLSLFSRRFLPKSISAKFDQKYNLLDIDYSKEMNVPILSGCFMFLRTEAIKKIGMFDNRFFMYLEDFDLVRRIHLRYKTMFLPSVQVIHEYAKGSYKNKKLMIYHIQSAIKYFNKWGWFFDFHRRKVNQIFIDKYRFK